MNDGNTRQPSRTLALPAGIFAALAIAIVACAGLFVGFFEAKPLPMPSAIAIANDGVSSTSTVEQNIFVNGLDCPGTLRMASTTAARFQIDGTVVSTSNAGGAMTIAEIRGVASGQHRLSIVLDAAPGGTEVIASLDLANGQRFVTDASWRTGGAFVAVSENYGDSGMGSALGTLPEKRSDLKGAPFFVPLICLIVAMAIACFAGPLLRPAEHSRPDTAIVDMAIVWPTIIYASAAFVITALAALPIGPAAIAGLHVVATTLFILLLVVWKKGSQFIERDQALHRAELSGYDSLMAASDLLAASLQDLPAELRAAVATKAAAVGEAVRFASTSTITADVDGQILGALQGLEERVAAQSLDANQFNEQADRILSLLRRREAIAQSSRRA